jgi:hypothetical protein
MESWKTIKFSNTEMTGPAKAIEAEAAVLDEKGIDYLISDYPEAPKRKTRKTVNNLDLEVRENGK